MWGRLAFFLGSWEGSGSGDPGVSRVERTYRLVLGDRFIQIGNVSRWEPTDAHPDGEVHEDLGVLSQDRARDRFVLRQFHVEGFVNQYAADPVADDAARIVFTSEAIENIPAGWRARETWELVGPDEFVETFELAPPGRDFARYTQSRLRRVAGS